MCVLLALCCGMASGGDALWNSLQYSFQPRLIKVSGRGGRQELCRTMCAVARRPCPTPPRCCLCLFLHFRAQVMWFGLLCGVVAFVRMSGNGGA